MKNRRRSGRAAGGMVLVLLCAAPLLGCLGKPGIEDRWTRIDVTASSVTPYQAIPPGTIPITVGANITYRAILTGFAVAELRASSTVSGATVRIDPDADRERMAYDIDRILANSVTMGRMTRAVTGWDHLIQHIDFSFTGNVPATLDSAGVPLGPPAGLFLLCYIGSGVKLRLANGTDSIVVTPFPSGTYQILPIGMEINSAPPGSF